MLIPKANLKRFYWANLNAGANVGANSGAEVLKKRLVIFLKGLFFCLSLSSAGRSDWQGGATGEFLIWLCPPTPAHKPALSSSKNSRTRNLTKTFRINKRKKSTPHQGLRYLFLSGGHF